MGQNVRFHAGSFEFPFEVCVMPSTSQDFKVWVVHPTFGNGNWQYSDHELSLEEMKELVRGYVVQKAKLNVSKEEIVPIDPISPVQKEEKPMLFKTLENEQMARSLVHVIDTTNRINLLCGHGLDQVYGPAYLSLKNLLNHVFGEDITRKAMNCGTWGPHDFDGKIIPAIEWAIEEVAQEKKHKRAGKMVKLIEEHHHTAHWDGDDHIVAVSGTPKEWKPEEETKIPLSWDKVYEWLGY